MRVWLHPYKKHNIMIQRCGTGVCPMRVWLHPYKKHDEEMWNTGMSNEGVVTPIQETNDKEMCNRECVQ